MKAVVLNGGRGTAMFPFANCYPKLMFPLGDEPLIKHLLRYLQKNNITEVAIISSDLLDLNKSLIARSENVKEDGMHISYFEETNSKGTAGTLKDLKSFIDSTQFLLICGNVFIMNLELSEILSFHQNRRAAVTVVVEESKGGKKDLENIHIGGDDVIKRFHTLHHSRDKRRILRSSGLYLFNPCVLDYISENSYMDIKEQLIPSLNSSGIPVHAYKMQGSVRNIDSLTDYFQLHKEILLNGSVSEQVISNAKTEIMNQVWIGENVEISPKAYLLGPVIIGDNCVIEDYSQIIGPTSIGSGTHIGRDVLVRESIVWEKAKLMNKSRIEYSLIGKTCIIPETEGVKNALVIQDKKYKSNFNYITLNDNNGIKTIINDKGIVNTFSYKALRQRIYSLTKRTLDVVLSFLGLFFLLPFFIIIAAAIKIDSHGPVFFLQRRCGKDGREFKMYKFRTMVEDAENLKEKLLDKNATDGPMFKMENDPRVTRVGRLLRKTSLDEIPQLFNVLKGEMSLVGPRPLEMEEMAFCPSWRDLRLSVTPGITGLWQVKKQPRISFDEWIKYDVEYIRQKSLRLDLKIIFKTFNTLYKGVKTK